MPSIIKLLMKNGFLNGNQSRNCLTIWTRSFSKRNQIKVVKFIEEQKHLEVNPNWELFSEAESRFYLPGNLGPALKASSYLTSSRIGRRYQFHFTGVIHPCPFLLMKAVSSFFPEAHFCQITILNLISQKVTDKEAKDQTEYLETFQNQFVVAAEEICSQLSWHGYWADFVDPYSGRAFSSKLSGGHQTAEQMSRSEDPLCAEICDQGGCLCIKGGDEDEDEDGLYQGRLFTDAPPCWRQLRTILAAAWIAKNQKDK